MILQLMQHVNTMSMDKFQSDILAIIPVNVLPEGLPESDGELC